MMSNIHVECDSLEQINYVLSSSILSQSANIMGHSLSKKSSQLNVPFTILENIDKNYLRAVMEEKQHSVHAQPQNWRT